MEENFNYKACSKPSEIHERLKNTSSFSKISAIRTAQLPHHSNQKPLYNNL
ncbi:hypothetical protein HMPREF1418_00968, partial [Helicobacter pylori GAM260BSi]